MRNSYLNYLFPFLLIPSIVLCFFVQKDLAVKRDEFLKETYMDYTLPSKVTGVAAMEFKGIVSDFLFLKVSTFLGGKFMKQEKLGSRHADYIYNSIDVITDIDPWFWDAYLIGNMLLTWDFQQFDQANKLLLKAGEYRVDDFKPPYYVGFNYFYFLKDNANGAKYMMKAAKLPGSPPYLTSLASRLSMYQNQYKPAILFLQEILATTQNPDMAKQFKTRLETLIIMDGLEKAVLEFRKAHGSFPSKITDLFEKGFIQKIPKDPYGGEFFILKNGRIFTTSKMVFKFQKTN